MIEIARVEPKKIQRKLLTEEQIKAICKKYRGKRIYCRTGCPLRDHIGAEFVCCSPEFKSVQDLEQSIMDYWNEEIEIEEECL